MAFYTNSNGWTGAGGGGSNLPAGGNNGDSLTTNGSGSYSWSSMLPIGGGTLTGFLTLHANPTDTFHAATKGYVDGSGSLLAVNNLNDLDNADTALLNLGLTATATELNYSDGVTSAIQNQLDLKASDSDAQGYGAIAESNANDYTDTAVSDYLPLAGGTLTGDLILDGDPTVDNQAATKKYVDDKPAPGITPVTLESPAQAITVAIPDSDSVYSMVYAIKTNASSNIIFVTINGETVQTNYSLNILYSTLGVVSYEAVPDRSYFGAANGGYGSGEFLTGSMKVSRIYDGSNTFFTIDLTSQGEGIITTGFVTRTIIGDVPLTSLSIISDKASGIAAGSYIKPTI